MKRFSILLLSLVMTYTFQSCDSDDNNSSEWQVANESAFNTIALNPEYIAVTTPGAAGKVYVKKLKNGSGTERPLYTSTVKIYYKGSYYDGSVFEQPPDGVAITSTTNGFVVGFAIALQNMVVGDKWEVWIPWDLGYGSYTSGSIPAYSTLVFEIELVEIVQNWN